MKTLTFLFLLMNLFLSSACVKVYLESTTSEDMRDSGNRTDKWINQDQLDSFDPFKTPQGLTTGANCPAKGMGAEALAQDTDVWCWAASAQTVMRFHGRNTLKQCEVVNNILGNGVTSSGGMTTPFCCGDGVFFPAQCWINGWPEWALESQNFNYSLVSGALKPDKLATELCNNGPIIFILKYRNSRGGHTLVVKDYVVDQARKKLSLWVYDHSWIDEVVNGKNQRIPLEYELWTYEKFAKAIWNGKQHIHDSDVVQIRPR